MIIEKSVVDGNRYDVSADDYVAEGEITVTITLREYRELVKTSVENKRRKDHEDWLSSTTGQMLLKSALRNWKWKWANCGRKWQICACRK